MITISTPLPFFFKYCELPLKIVACAFLLGLSIQLEEWIFGVIVVTLLVWGTIESFKINLRLKRIYLNENSLTVDNFKKGIQIDLKEIESITLKKNVIGVINFKSSTEFGKTIYFLPQYWDIVDMYTRSLISFGENKYELLIDRVEKTCNTQQST